MVEKQYATPFGDIHYWVSRNHDAQAQWLVFLPGLTADHHLFDKQIPSLQERYNCLVWDAPGHGASRPAQLQFTLQDLAHYLHDILEQEQITAPIFIGQSMGGYVSQAYLQAYPGSAAGFIAVDSGPLQRAYYAKWELAFLKHTKGMYQIIPWKQLVKMSAVGNAETDYGRDLMRTMMQDYSKQEFCALAGHGFRIIAEAIEQCTDWQIDCLVLLLCGEQDQAGFVKRYNKQWTKRAGYPLMWLPGAGHNSNTDKPEQVNQQIEQFVKFVREGRDVNEHKYNYEKRYNVCNH